MPSLSISKRRVLSLIGGQVEEENLNQMIFDFGIEIDDIYEEGGETMYKLDIAANRYDLLCVEGLATAMKSYILNERFEDIKINAPTITVIKEKTHEREYIACAVIRGIDFDSESYESFISYQDKLHGSIGRNRSLVAIGTHDLDSIKIDPINGADEKITYKTIEMDDAPFTPLNGQKIKVSELESYYKNDKKISKYFDLLSDNKKAVSFVYKGTMLSIPPIINSNESKITKNTKNIFIEATGTDFNKVNTALKLVLYNFRGAEIEAVKIVEAEGGKELVTPVICDLRFDFDPDQISKKLNLKLERSEITSLLRRMMYFVADSGNTAGVIHVPDLRSDVMHICDVIEDVAIAYGFNNFVKNIPDIYTPGKENPLNKFTDKVRYEMAFCGFNEVHTLTLLSSNENFVNSAAQAVLENPKSKEFEVVRTSLLPGLLKSVSSNLHARIPIRIFEASDVVFLTSETDEGALNRRHLCGVTASNTAKLEELQGPLSFLFEKCGISNYRYEHLSDHRYIENQAASVMIGEDVVGTIGVIHPSVNGLFKIPYAMSAFEVDLEMVFSKSL